MRSFRFLGLLAAAVAGPALAAASPRTELHQGAAEIRRERRVALPASRRVRSRNKPQRRVGRANRLTISRRVRRRHRRQRRAA